MLDKIIARARLGCFHGVVRSVALALGYEMTGGTVEGSATFIRDDTTRYARLIKALGDVIE